MADFGVGFKLTADATSFERGMASAARSAETVGKKISSAFDGRAIGRTLATALGLSLDSIADKVARWAIGFSKDVQDALDKMVEDTGRSADKMEMERDRKREIAKKKEEEEAKRLLDEYMMIREARIKGNEDIAKREKEQAQERIDRALDAFFIEGKIADEKEDQKKQAEKALAVEKEQALIAEERKIAEEKIAQAKLDQLNSDIRANFMGQMLGATGGPDLSTASAGALKEIISRAKNKMQGLTPGTAFNFGDSLQITTLQNQINRAQKELDFRATLQSNVSRYGVEGARSLFSGDPLAFDRVVQQYAQDSRDLKTILAGVGRSLENIDKRQMNGLPVLNINNKLTP